MHCGLKLVSQAQYNYSGASFALESCAHALHANAVPIYSRSAVTLENSPFSSLVFQNICTTSLVGILEMLYDLFYSRGSCR